MHLQRVLLKVYILQQVFNYFFSLKNVFNIMFFALQLLIRSAADRLGSGPNEECDIKLHAFYRMIDWQRLQNKEVQPPFKPKIVRHY